MAPADLRVKHTLSFRPDELVVATPHLDIVLDRLGPGARIRDANPVLGLTLVALDDVADTAARVVRTQPKRRSGRTEDLDLVLETLRARFATDWDGWAPTLGKNRDVLGGETPYLKPLTDPEAPGVVEAEDAPYTGIHAADRLDGGAGVRIGIIDTPVTAATAAQPWVTASPADILAVDEPVPYRLGHGTFLTGLVHQYAPEAEITVRAVLRDPDATGSVWDVATGLVDLVRPDPASGRAPVDVVVMALGCFTADRRPPLVLQTAVSLLGDDAVLLAAAGNHADLSLDEMHETGITRTTPSWPAALDGVTAIGSTGPGGTVSAFSPTTPWVDLAARGEGLCSTYLSGKVRFGVPGLDGGEVDSYHGYARWSGTSLAVAVAAGRLATARSAGEDVRSTLARLRGSGDAPYVVRTAR